MAENGAMRIAVVPGSRNRALMVVQGAQRPSASIDGSRQSVLRELRRRHGRGRWRRSVVDEARADKQLVAHDVGACNQKLGSSYRP